MNKHIKIIVVIALIILTSVVVKQAVAADLIITCVTHGPCTMTPNPGDALFGVANMLPGDTEKQTITVYNEDPDNDCRNLTLHISKTKEEPSNFADMLYTAIKKDGVELYGDEVAGEAAPTNTLEDLFTLSSLGLGSVPKAGSSVIDWFATFEKSSGNEFQRAETKFDFTIYFECNSEFPGAPELTIAKFNNQWPDDQSTGAEISYTITLVALDAPVYNVITTDLLPENFQYQHGSYFATMNGSPLTIPEPTYASPGKWYVGDMAKGDAVVLTYKAKIGDSKKPGLYKDIAWAYGCKNDTTCSTEDDGMVVLATSVDSLSVDPGVITENHVGTKIRLVKDETEGVRKDIVREETVLGYVLGASTALPATGAKTYILTFAGFLLTLGIYLILKKNTYR